MSNNEIVALEWTPHPILEIPSKREQLKMGSERLLRYFDKREKAIALSKEDPYYHQFENPVWKIADKQLETHSEVLVAGGNRGSKSRWAISRVVRTLCENPNTIIYCFSETASTSVNTQQAMVWELLPSELKSLNKKRGTIGSISWSLKSGFTQNKIAFPNGSQLLFKHYSQSEDTIEGAELGSPQPVKPGTFNIGWHCDELVPMSFIERLRYRTLTRADKDTGLPARGLITFTAVTGYNLTVKNFMSGAQILQEEDADPDLLPGEKVPIVMQPIRKTSRVVFFGTHTNPFGGWEAMKKSLDGMDKATIRCRAYGVPARSAGTPFPLLSEKNVWKHKDIPIVKAPKKNPANYFLIIDPAGARPFSIILIGIDPHGVAWIIDEFPNVDEHGPWVDFSQGEKGRPGDGQLPVGFGIKDYADQIRKMEKGKGHVERLIDPRMGNASYAKSDGCSTIIDDLTEEGIIVNPADGVQIEEGVMAINNMLNWNTEEPWGRQNRPSLMISDKCQNTLSCLQEWRHDGDSKSPTKDFVDCVRYFAVTAGNHGYVSEEDLRVTGTGGY